MTTRRRFLTQSIAVGSAAWLSARSLRAGEALRFSKDPFTLGVASGYPTPDGVVLWTRLAPEPLAPGGGVDAPVVPVDWQLATDERFANVVRSGTEYATADWAHSVHVELIRLEPAREYWYRFTAGGVQSPVGRTRTAPAAGTSLPRLRFTVTSCQQYEHGYYTAYRYMLADELDFIVNVGDYIYEQSWGVPPFVRQHPMREAYTLDQYRTIYGLYKSDPDLKAAHAAYPWFVTWDDHEVDNDYAADVSENDDDPQWFRARREAAYRAYYEHMPLPRNAVPFGASMNLFANATYGDLVSLYLLDERQYRTPRPCAPQPGGRKTPVDCPELANDQGTMLGARQEKWFDRRVAASKARWNLIAQGLLMSHNDEAEGPGRRYWTDAWNGYPATRARVLASLERHRASNPVMFSGDIHTFLVGGINARPDDLSTPLVATEFVGTSVSSQGLPESRVDSIKRENPNFVFGTSQYRGYLRADVTPGRLGVDLVAIDSVLVPDSPRRVLAAFAVADGVAGPQRG
jgi:alkaline phosphatase D